jgi:hypothetical protein
VERFPSISDHADTFPVIQLSQEMEKGSSVAHATETFSEVQLSGEVEKLPSMSNHAFHFSVIQSRNMVSFESEFATLDSYLRCREWRTEMDILQTNVGELGAPILDGNHSIAPLAGKNQLLNQS